MTAACLTVRTHLKDGPPKLDHLIVSFLVAFASLLLCGDTLPGHLCFVSLATRALEGLRLFAAAAAGGGAR